MSKGIDCEYAQRSNTARLVAPCVSQTSNPSAVTEKVASRLTDFDGSSGLDAVNDQNPDIDTGVDIIATFDRLGQSGNTQGVLENHMDSTG